MRVAPHVTVIPLGWESPHQLDATYPHTLRKPDHGVPIWYCCAQRLPVSPRLNWLVSVALILSLCLAVFAGEPLAPALSYAVRTFLQCVVSQIAPATA